MKTVASLATTTLSAAYKMKHTVIPDTPVCASE